MKVYAKVRYNEVVLSGWVFGEVMVGYNNISFGLIGTKENGADFHDKDCIEPTLRDIFGDDLIEWKSVR